MKNSKYILAITVVAALQASPVWAEDNFLPDVQQQGDIYYITGGIGDEETKAMQSERGDYNLQVMNAFYYFKFAEIFKKKNIAMNQ